MTAYESLIPNLAPLAQTLLDEARSIALGSNSLNCAHVLLAALDYNMAIPTDNMSDYSVIASLLGSTTASNQLRTHLLRNSQRTPSSQFAATPPDDVAPDLGEALERAQIMCAGMKVAAASIIHAILDSSAGVGHDFAVIAGVNGIAQDDLLRELKVATRQEQSAYFAGSNSYFPGGSSLQPVVAVAPFPFADRHKRMTTDIIVELQKKRLTRKSGIICIWGMPGTLTKVTTQMLADGIAAKSSALATAFPDLTGVVEQDLRSIARLPRERAIQQLASAIGFAGDKRILVLRHLESLGPGGQVENETRQELLNVLGSIGSEFVIAHYQTKEDVDPNVGEVMGLELASSIHCHPFDKQYTFMTIRDYYLSEWEQPGGVYFPEIERPLGARKASSSKSESDNEAADVKRMSPAFGLLFDLRDGIWYDGRHMAPPYSIIQVIEDCKLRLKWGIYSQAQTALTTLHELRSQLPDDHQCKAYLVRAEQLADAVVKEHGALQQYSDSRTCLFSKHLIVELFSKGGAAAFHLPPLNRAAVGESDQTEPHSGSTGATGKVSPIRPK